MGRMGANLVRDQFRLVLLLLAAWSIGVPPVFAEEGEASAVPASHAPEAQRAPGAVDLGLGLGFADVPNSFGVGLDVMGGYEWEIAGGGHAGVQMHYMGSSWTTDSYQTLGVFATTRAENKWLSWLQFKMGMVSDNSYAMVPICNQFCIDQPVSWSSMGPAVGMGISVDNGGWIVHLLDVERHFVAGHAFNLYSVSILVLAH
jgi:hypothetical protein